MKRVAIFASGSGTNAEKIIDYFAEVEDIDIALIVCNRPGAGVLDVAERNGVSHMLIDREYFYKSNQILFELHQHSIEFIVLAGFLWLVPSYLIKSYKNRIVNIHPALLPKFGGKGMYGMHVHRAVKNAGDDQSGMTIHYVDEEYDEGTVIFQASCNVDETDTAQSIQKKVQKLEHLHYPHVIEEVIRNELSRD